MNIKGFNAHIKREKKKSKLATGISLYLGGVARKQNMYVQICTYIHNYA